MTAGGNRRKSCFLVGFSTFGGVFLWLIGCTQYHKLTRLAWDGSFVRAQTKTAEDPFGMNALKVKPTLAIELKDLF